MPEKTLKTRFGRVLVLPTPEEDAAITAAALSDPDARPLTDEEWKRVKPLVRFGRPPKPEGKKQLVSIRLDPDVLAALKATGRGWQTRINDVMRKWVAEHAQI